MSSGSNSKNSLSKTKYNVVLIRITIILIYFMQGLNCQSKTGDIDFIYSPFFQQKYDITDPQGASTKIKVAEKANLVFISAGFAGIIVLDGNTNEIIFEQKAQEFLFTVEATSDGEYVMMSYQSQFSIFKFVDRKQLVLMSQSDFPTSILDMFIDSTESTVYAVGLKGQLVGYSIINKNNIEKVGFYNSLSNIIHQGYISQDGNWILLGNDTNGLYVLKVNKNTVDNQQEYELAGYGITLWKTWGGIITSDNQYIYIIDNWNGIFICEFNQILKVQSFDYPIILKLDFYWPFSETNPYVYSIKLSKDQNYLFVGVRSQGVYIFDIKDRINPIFFQSISVGAHAFSVNLSADEKYLYYANAQSIYVFGKTTLNLNNNYPNLFNIHQASQQYLSPAYFKWRCYIKNINNKQYYFGPTDINGVYIFDSTNPYELKEIFFKDYEPLTLIDSLEFSADNKYLYVPLQEDNTAILVLDITDISNPVEAFRLKMENPNHGEAIFFSKDYQYMVLSYDNGVLLIDPSNPPKLVLLDYWQVLPYMSGENCGVMITNDNNWVIGAVRGYGLYLLDARIKNKLKYVTSIQTLGAEGITPSLYDDSYAYLYDGFKGVAILDLKALPELKILSRVSLQGWSNYLLPIQNDSYLLVAQMEQGMVSLIDIQDKSNPKIISTYQYQTQTAESICLTPDQQYTFINNNKGSVVLPLRSQVQIHTEVQQIMTNEDGTQTLISISKDQYLKVGQKIQFNFVPLFPKEGMKILSVSYYDQEQIKSLPFWITYDSKKRNLLLEIDKSGLGTQINKPNLNTILLKIAIPLKIDNFIYEYPNINTTPEQAEIIYKYLQEIKLIDFQGIISDQFKFDDDLKLQIDGIPSTEILLQQVRFTLSRGSYVNPVLFYIEPSLELDIKDQENPIKTLASSVQLFLTVEPHIGKFVLINFAGVIASTTDEQDQIKLEGSTDNLNKILQQKIIFANKISISQLSLKISLIDGVNFQVTQTQLISECTFIKLKEQLKKNPQLRLQDQFSKAYKSSIINIQEEFSIDFKPESFIVSDIQLITYQALILVGNEYVEITPDNWIQFQSISGNINFHGIPPVSALNQIFNLRVIASDGYTSDFDDFFINSSGLPFFYVFNLLVKIFGPLFALFGVYKYKSFILNSMFRNIVMFSPEIAFRSRLYKKKIPILGDDNLKCRMLFEEFIIKFFNDRAKYKEETQLIKNTLQRYKTNSCGEGSNYLENTSQKLRDNYQSDYSIPRRLKVMMGKENTKLQNSIRIIQMSPKHTRSSPLEIEYLNKDGNVSLSKIMRDISHKNITFTLKRKKYSVQSFITDFRNRESRIYRGLRATASRYFLKMDLRSQEIYEYIKYHAITSLSNNKKDWYKAVVNIIATDKKDCYGYPTPFPELTLKEDVINLILIDLQIHNQIGQSFDSIGMLDINYNLIREVLFADTLGLVEMTPSSLSPCIGESIHLHSYDIGSVEAFQQIKNAWCMSLRKIFNLEYAQYGMSKNMTLPNWINFDRKNGVIILEGTPQSQDVENLLLRIIDIDFYVIKQYQFNVVDEFCHQDEDPIEDKSYLVTLQDDQLSQIKFSQQKSKLSQQYSLQASFNRDLSASSIMRQPMKTNNREFYEQYNSSIFKPQNDKSMIDLNEYQDQNQFIQQQETPDQQSINNNKSPISQSNKLFEKFDSSQNDSPQHISLTNQGLDRIQETFVSQPNQEDKLDNQQREQQYQQHSIELDHDFMDLQLQDKKTEQNITTNRDEITKREDNTQRQLIPNSLEKQDLDKEAICQNQLTSLQEYSLQQKENKGKQIQQNIAQNNISDQTKAEDIELNEEEQQNSTKSQINNIAMIVSKSHFSITKSITPPQQN